MAYILAEKSKQKNLYTTWGTLLVKNGFILKEDHHGHNLRSKYKYDPDKKAFSAKEGTIDPEHAMMEYSEDILINAPYQSGGADYVPTGYPSPLKRYRIMYETTNLSVESVYFWIIDQIRYDQGFARAYKIRDVFTATENSAFFGMSQQRLGIQQDRVQQYLATIGKMTKDLFQLVRELRILDEKMLPRTDWKTSKSADVTLKSEYVDLVENRGGQTSPGSIYGLAQQLGYATLPDLFFNTQVYRQEDVDKEVDKLSYNINVKNVLRRKLYQYLNWKLKTDHELESRRKFTLKYLRQHWDIIEMYMAWIKPYLRHIARLQMNEEKLESIDMIAAFEQAYVEIESLFAKQQLDGDGKHSGKFEIILLTIDFRTRPNMSFVQEGYQKGPVHVGQADIYFRAYSWSQDNIDAYIRYREQEDLYMIGVIDKSVQSAMEALGEELEHYLAEAGEPKYKDKLDKEKADAEKRRKAEESRHGLFTGVLEPFSAVGSGFGEMFGFGVGNMFSFASAKQKPKSFKFSESIWSGGKMPKNLTAQLYQTMKNFKKAYGMLSWG